jgi:hypothetical protein
MPWLVSWATRVSMLSLPTPYADRRVGMPIRSKKARVASMAARIRSDSLPEVMPRTRSPYWSSLACLASRRSHSIEGSTTAKVRAWSMPNSAVNSWPIMWVAQSWGTPAPISPFRARVAAHMRLARTS